MLNCLVIEEVEHVFDGQRQGRSTVSNAEYGLEQIIDVLLQRDLKRIRGERVLGTLSRV